MEKLFKTLTAVLFALLMSVSFTACGDGDNDPDNPDKPDTPTVSPDKDVADPVGTIPLSMRDYDNGRTRLGNIYIEDENFDSNGYVWFASLGTVKGLGNVAHIPTNGWTQKIKVTPGNGYVAYDINKQTYYRIYVVDYILSTLGGVIGADIKYQEPFKGVDEEIKLTETSISFPEEGGSQALFFNNEKILVFSAESDKEWCKVARATDKNVPFLYNGVVISVDKLPMEASKATVTITTAFGRKKTVSVSYAGYEPYFELGDMTGLENITYEGGTFNVGLTTNCFSESSFGFGGYIPNWISFEIINNTDKMRQRAIAVKYVENKPVSRTESYNSANDVYSIRFNVTENTQNTKRNATFFANTPLGEQSFNISQNFHAYLTAENNTEIEYTATGSLLNDPYPNHSSQIFGYNTNIDRSELEFSVDFGTSEEWFNAWIDYGYHGIYMRSIEPNASENERRATIKLASKDGSASLLFTVTQKGDICTVNGLTDGIYYCDRKQGSYTISVDALTPVTFSSSNPEWCTITYNNGSLVLRVSDNTGNNRKATITCSSPNGSFEVHQSKYAVGDDYSEGNIAGKVCGTANGEGRIYKILEGPYKWSTENITTGCADDGKKNMEIIKAIPNWQNFYPVFAAVDALNTSGVTGWYLASYSEYSKYNQAIQELEFWTSTEKSSSMASSKRGQTYKQTETYGNRPLGAIAFRDFTY